MENKKTIGIMVPTRSRPERLRFLFDSFLSFKENLNIDFVVGIDSDQLDLYSWVKDFDIRVVETPAKDYVPKANFMAQQMLEYDYLYLLADDFVINSPVFSIFLSEAKPFAMFYGRDSFMNSKLPTAVFMDNEYNRRLGYIAPPTLVHYFADNIWAEWGKAMGMYRYFDNVNVQHLHKVADSKYDDEVYTNSEKHFGEDEKAYEKYMTTQFNLDVKKLQK